MHRHPAYMSNLGRASMPSEAQSLGCGCAQVGSGDGAPCSCAGSDDNKRQFLNDVLLVVSLLTAIYALVKKG